MIVRCDAVENYIFLRDSQLVQVLYCKVGKLPRIACFYSIPYRCKIDQPDTLQ